MMSTKSEVNWDFAASPSLITLGEECFDVELLFSGHRVERWLVISCTADG